MSQGVNCAADKNRKRGDAVVDRGLAKPRESRIGYISENEIVLSNQGSGHGLGVSTATIVCARDQIDVPYFETFFNEIRVYLP